MRPEILKAALCALLFCATAQAAQAQESAEPPDLMSFAHGVLPVAVVADPVTLKTGMAEATRVIDGNPVGFVLTPKWGPESYHVEIIYRLPAPTRFTRFAVPNVLETPSPSQTFVSTVAVSGSGTSADGPYSPLADGALTVHAEKGQVTELTLAADQPEVLWVKLRLSGGLDLQRDMTFFEFSELIGNGEQALPAMSDRFTGVWKGRGVDIELAQDGPSVTGCYDKRSLLSGTVEGNVLRAIGAESAGVISQFIAIVDEDGGFRGLRSSNGAPFRQYDGETSGAAPVCLAPEPPTLGCGDTVHGIGFGYDSDVLRASSDALIAKIHAGLSAETGKRIEIVGHSSAEGAADYNRDLSERRAASVVAALVALGLDPALVSAAGKGEDEPIASNDDEAGRSMNRRVEIRCSG